MQLLVISNGGSIGTSGFLKLMVKIKRLKLDMHIIIVCWYSFTTIDDTSIDKQQHYDDKMLAAFVNFKTSFKTDFYLWKRPLY